MPGLSPAQTSMGFDNGSTPVTTVTACASTYAGKKQSSMSYSSSSSSKGGKSSIASLLNSQVPNYLLIEKRERDINSFPSPKIQKKSLLWMANQDTVPILPRWELLIGSLRYPTCPAGCPQVNSICSPIRFIHPARPLCHLSRTLEWRTRISRTTSTTPRRPLRILPCHPLHRFYRG